MRRSPSPLRVGTDRLPQLDLSLSKQRLDRFKHSLGDDRVSVSGWMDAIFEIEVRPRSDSRQEEMNEKRLVLPGEIDVQVFEITDVIRAVVARQRHARENHRRTAVLKLHDHLFQVLFRFLEWKTAQAVVGSKFQDHDLWFGV